MNMTETQFSELIYIDVDKVNKINKSFNIFELKNYLVMLMKMLKSNIEFLHIFTSLEYNKKKLRLCTKGTKL